MISQSIPKLDAIFRAAAELFAEAGIDATPTALIAARAGVANGTLFHYFKTKDDLIRALYSETKKEILAVCLTGLDEHLPFFIILRNMRASLLDWSKANRNSVKFLLQYQSSPAFLQNPHDDQLSAVLEALIRLGISNGELALVPVELHLDFILEHFNGLMRKILVNPELSDDSDYPEASFLLLQRALSKEKKR